MGTRADYYLGRGPDAVWLGSISWDGYPAGIFAHKPGFISLDLISDDLSWSTAVETFLNGRDDSTMPEQGWPWPWEDSCTTDYAYAYDEGKIWGCSFGHEWFELDMEKTNGGEPLEDDEAEDYVYVPQPKTAVFPNMKDRQNVRLDGGSGLIIINAG